jgi:hypothetical protein
MDTRPRWRTRRRTADAAAASGPAATWTAPRGYYQPSGRHRQVAAGPQAHRTPWQCRQAAACRAADTWSGHPVGGGAAAADPQAAAWVRCRSRRVCMDGRLPAAAVSPPCSRGCGGVRGRPRPSGQHPAALPAAPRTLPRCPVPWTPAEGSAPGRRRRRTSTVQTRGQRTRLVDAGSPQVPGAADTRDGGRVVRTLRQGHAGQPAAQPSTAPHCRTRNGTGRCGIGQYRHGLTARSVAWCSASIWSAPDGSRQLRLGAWSVQPDRERSRRIVRMIKQGRRIEPPRPSRWPSAHLRAGCRGNP